MKQYGRFFKNLLGVILAMAMVLSFASCSENNQPSGDLTTPAPTLNPSSAVMTIHGYEISKGEYTIMLYDAAVELKRNEEEKLNQEMTDEEYEEWFFNFYNIAIDGKMPFDIVRENVLVDLKEYAYYMQAIKRAGLTMDDADRNDIETNVLISVGEEYDPENPDDYFVYTYGVTKNEYVDYLVNLALIDSYIDTLAAKETVKQEDIDAYLDSYRSHYMVWSIQEIYLEATTEDEFATKKALGDSLAQRIQNGENMKNLVKKYSEAGSDGDGIFTVSKDEWSYPISILDWVYSSEVGNVGVVTAEDGIHVLKCITMAVEEDANAEIQYVLGVEQVKKAISAACEKEEWAPQLNASIYNSFTKLPGDLMISDSAVG